MLFFIADILNLVDATLQWYDLNKNRIACLPAKKIITLKLNVVLTLINPNSNSYLQTLFFLGFCHEIVMMNLLVTSRPFTVSLYDYMLCV